MILDGEDDATIVARLEVELAEERGKREAAERLAEERGQHVENLTLALRLLEEGQEDPYRKRLLIVTPVMMTLAAAALGLVTELSMLPFGIVFLILTALVGIMFFGSWTLASRRPPLGRGTG